MAEDSQVAKQEERGLRYWMERVIAEAEKANNGFKADPVHDLRTAMRRCRSIAEGFAAIDPEPAWKKMRKAAKPLFSALGDLRDVQVQMEWVEKIATKGDPVRGKLLDHFQQREDQLKSAAGVALSGFDLNQWSQWTGLLDERAHRLPPGDPVFQVMALERWRDARVLQSTALRNRSKVALHELRIGIKKFRYIVENFLPEHHERWIKNLKRVQDLLGEVHDLDVLWETARVQHVFENPAQRTAWVETIKSERTQRVEAYRAKMLGNRSLWQQWRSGLPDGEALHAAVLNHFETWAFFRDPDLAHTHRVLEISLSIFKSLEIAKRYENVTYRDLLTVAALTHEAGSSGKGVLKSIRKLTAPPGWKPQHLEVVGMIARYHRGKFPSDSENSYSSLDEGAKSAVNLLGGILRLAEAIEANHEGQSQSIRSSRTDCALRIEAPGFQGMSPEGERVARARHLLEVTIGIPVIVTG